MHCRRPHRCPRHKASILYDAQPHRHEVQGCSKRNGGGCQSSCPVVTKQWPAHDEDSAHTCIAEADGISAVPCSRKRLRVPLSDVHQLPSQPLLQQSCMTYSSGAGKQSCSCTCCAQPGCQSVHSATQLEAGKIPEGKNVHGLTKQGAPHSLVLQRLGGMVGKDGGRCDMLTSCMLLLPNSG